MRDPGQSAILSCIGAVATTAGLFENIRP